MRGVGPGTVLGGRYTVRRRLEQLHDTERWSADDTTLGRTVSLLCIGGSDHRTPAMLDAARRAASVSNGVFVRILDVGSDDDVSYVVEEDLGEARTLAELVIDGGVPGDEVRRIAGEVAAALESAGQRGMHHLDLKPDDVLRTPDGDIRLRGLETAAVRAGEDDTESDDAARRDAVGVVALTYAGLTGLWPLGAGGAGLAAAPRVPGGVAAPSEIAAGVPRDLDAICRLTLNDDQGPTSPGDFARQVAPWPSRQVVGRPVTRTVPEPPPLQDDAADAARAAGDAPDFDVVADELLEPSDTLEQPAVHADPELDETTQVRLTPASAAPSEAAAPAAAPPARPRKRPLGRRDSTALGAAGAAAAGAAAAGGAEAAGAATASGGAMASGASAAAVSEADESTHVLPRADDAPDWLRNTPDTTTTTAAATTVTTRGTDGEWLDEPDQPYQPDEDGAGGRPGAGTATAAAGAGAAVAGAFGSVGERVGSMARRAVDKVSELSPDTAPREDRGDLEAPAPLVPAEPLTKDESKLALAIVVGFVVLALVVGIVGVRKIGSGSDSVFGGDAAPATRTTTVAPSSAAPSSGEATSTGGTSAAEPLAILKVEAYDPEGDGQENNSLTPKTYDGDNSTGWFSENYRSDSFGGLKKGVGVIVDLGPNKKPQAVELNVPHPSDIEVYVGPDNRLEGATKIGEKADADGTVTFDVPADVSGQYIVVWFTKLNADENGKRRAWLDEVVVTG